MTETVTTDCIVLVGAHVDDIESEFGTRPFIAGCIDVDTADVMGADEVDEWFNEMKRKYDAGDVAAYQWREVRVKLDRRTLAGLFATATLEGVIEDA